MRAAGLAAALIVGLALPGCSGHQGTDSDARPLVMVLFDVSKSTQAPAIRERYLSSFERVVDAVASEHGTVVGDVIDENPLAHSSYPIDATFESCDPLRDNRLVGDARTATLRDDVTAGAEAILRTVPARGGTDIHDGLRPAGPGHRLLHDPGRAVPQRIDDPSPIGIAPMPTGFHQRAIGNRPRRGIRISKTLCAVDSHGHKP